MPQRRQRHHVFKQHTLALRTALCRLHTKDLSGDPSCHGHPLCLPDQPPLTARTSLWDSTGCRERIQHTSPQKGGASATLLNVCGRRGPSRTEPLCREHRGFFPECQNPWIPCMEARIHLGQLPLNLLTAKGQASSMGSKDRLCGTEHHWSHHSLSPPLRKAGCGGSSPTQQARWGLHRCWWATSL